MDEGNVSVEVLPSEESGNVPVDTPSVEPTTVETPAPVETVEPTEPVAELFDLPDGRKVDAETLSREWKENFLPDYTRKSQELAKTKTEPLQTKETPNNPYADPNYVPQSYEEILKVAEERALQAIEAKEQARIASQQAVENEVVNQLTEVKKLDPSLNENSLFLHATKYGFRDLKLAHQNMKDMSEMAKKVQTTTAANIAKRNDPVSVSHGATGARPDPSNFSTARDYLKSLKS